MTYTLRCGRLDPHDAHEWSTPHVRRTYHCGGHVLVGAVERYWDAADDAAEDAMDRARREAS